LLRRQLALVDDPNLEFVVTSIERLFVARD